MDYYLRRERFLPVSHAGWSLSFDTERPIATGHYRYIWAPPMKYRQRQETREKRPLDKEMTTTKRRRWRGVNYSRRELSSRPRRGPYILSIRCVLRRHIARWCTRGREKARRECGAPERGLVAIQQGGGLTVCYVSHIPFRPCNNLRPKGAHDDDGGGGGGDQIPPGREGAPDGPRLSITSALCRVLQLIPTHLTDLFVHLYT